MQASRLLPALVLAAACGVLGGAGSARGQGAPRFDAIGLLDYERPPDFKVGSWVTYRVTGRSEQGMRDDYTLTVVIAGEEEFWGERCFWLETTTGQSGGGGSTVATLISYDAFKDPGGVQKMQYYLRKTVAGVDESGKPKVEILKIPRGKLKTPPVAPPALARDTLGADTVSTPKGTFPASVYRFRQGYAESSDRGDSTVRETYMEKRTTHMSLQIPVTHLVKEIIEVEGTRKAWRIGESADSAPETVRDRARGEAVVVDFGEGRASTAVPEPFRRSIEEQKREAARAGSAARKAGP